MAREGLPVPEGYDRNKWYAGHQSEKYRFGESFARYLLGQGGSFAESAALIGATPISGDTMRLKSGELIDVLRLGRHQQWLVLHPKAGAPTPQGMRRVMPGDPDYDPRRDGPKRNGYLVPITKNVPPATVPGTETIIPAAEPRGLWSPEAAGARITVREEVLDRAEMDLPTESSPQLATEQRDRNWRAAISTGSVGSLARKVATTAVGLGAGPGEALAISPARVAPSPPRRKRNIFSRAVRGIGRGLRAAGRGIGRAVTSPVGAVAIGVAGAALIPGVGSLLGRGAIAAGKGIARGALGAVRGASVVGRVTTRGAIAAGRSVGREAGRGWSTRAGISAPGYAGGTFTPGAPTYVPFDEEFPYEPPVEPLVYTIDDAIAGDIPEPPFYAFIAGQVETVVQLIDDPTYGVILILADGYELAADDWYAVELEGAA